MKRKLPLETSRLFSAAIRLTGFDTLRGIAAVLVVLVHAGIPYMTCPIPHLVWPARDQRPSAVVDGLTWFIACFIMPLFFLLAGFFSQGQLVSRGDRAFLKGRTRRVLWTQLVAGVVILPVCLAVWTLGWIADGLYVPEGLLCLGLPPELRADLYGIGHLWFLQYLYIYCLILCGFSWLAKRVRRGQRVETDSESLSSRPLDRSGRLDPSGPLDSILRSVWKPLLPAIPCAIIIFCDARSVLGFYQSFTPVISKLAYHAIYFFVGALLYRQRQSMHDFARFCRPYLFIGAVVFAAALPLIHEHTTIALTGPRLALLSGLLSQFAWLMTFGLFAVFLQTTCVVNVVTRYLSEASFWIYLVHMPFVALTQIAIVQLPVPTIGKFLLAATTALVLALLTYHVFVRGTWVGLFLDGHTRSYQELDFQRLLRVPVVHGAVAPDQPPVAASEELDSKRSLNVPVVDEAVAPSQPPVAALSKAATSKGFD